MTATYTLEQIRPLVEHANFLPQIESGFVLYSEGKAVVPPVGELVFRDPPGDVHIKYGYLKGDQRYLIKVASGFYHNSRLGLNPTPGLMLVASQKTGEIEAILLEEGYLTNLRTAVAGAVTAKYLAPRQLRRIAIFGTGVQARLQLEQLRHVTPCRDIIVWGRRQQALDEYQATMSARGYRVTTTLDVAEACADADLLVTVTASEHAYITERMIKPGTHITAVGADAPYKTEIAPGVLGRADVVVADSVEQCVTRGEIHHAVAAGLLDRESIRELGAVIRDPTLGRIHPDQITVADLTGVAVQDIVIATATLAALGHAAAVPS